VSTFNTNLVLLEQLYQLTYWTENGLRAQLDLVHSARLGSGWYQWPDQYLPPAVVSAFVADASMPEIRWEVSSGPAKKLTELPNSGAFVEALTFGWLAQMVEQCHTRENRRILLPPDGKPLMTSKVKNLLKIAKEARNDVAHLRPLNPQKYRYYEKEVLQILEIMHFDVARAKERLGVRRSLVLRQMSKQ